MKNVLLLIIIIFVSFIFYILEDIQYNQKIKSGKILLECNLKDKGWVIIDSGKILNFDSDLNIVTFVNGYSTNCRIYK